MNTEINIEYYLDENGKNSFHDWVESFRDGKTRSILFGRLARVRVGNLGRCESLGQGIFELKIDYGPGYRIYFGYKNLQIVLILLGGEKSTQRKDILKAQAFWTDYRRRNL